MIGVQPQHHGAAIHPVQRSTPLQKLISSVSFIAGIIFLGLGIGTPPLLGVGAGFLLLAVLVSFSGGSTGHTYRPAPYPAAAPINPTRVRPIHHVGAVAPQPSAWVMHPVPVARPGTTLHVVPGGNGMVTPVRENPAPPLPRPTAHPRHRLPTLPPTTEDGRIIPGTRAN